MRNDADTVAAQPASVHVIAGYGGRSARLRHAVCRPRFLRGVIVRMVWCELEKPGGGWARTRLLLSSRRHFDVPGIAQINLRLPKMRSGAHRDLQALPRFRCDPLHHAAALAAPAAPPSRLRDSTATALGGSHTIAQVRRG